MNSLELAQLLAPLPNHTVGVYPSDLIPQNWQKPIAFICNIQDSKKSGLHWIAIFVNNKSEGFYFDSYGLAPFVANISNVLRKNCKTIKFNDRQVQSDSSAVCGHFCVMFLYYMAHGIDMQAFLNLFSEKNLLANDEIAEKFVKNLRQRNMSKKNKDIFVGDGYKNSSLPSQVCRSKKCI